MKNNDGAKRRVRMGCVRFPCKLAFSRGSPSDHEPKRIDAHEVGVSLMASGRYTGIVQRVWGYPSGVQIAGILIAAIVYLVISENRGTQYRPQTTVILLIIRDPQKGTPNFGNLHV